jgi:hypothetical protein
MFFREIGSLAAALVGAAGIAQSVLAQEPAPNPAAEPGQPHTMFFISNAAPVAPFGGTVDIIHGAGSVMGAVVTEKPYSADAITETTQILADGNRITQRNETSIYRDSQGRTRREQTLSALGAWQTVNEPATMITIEDPVAGVSYFIDPQTEIARELRPFALTSIEAEPGTGPSVQPFELPLPPPVAGVRAFPPLAATAISAFGPGETATEDLGEQILEGLRARGTRHTQTIAAGAIGNERPIEIVTENWYSAEIEADVLRRHSDPRFGETTYRLVNVVLGDPSADLFAVPEGYEVRTDEGPFMGTKTFRLERTPEAAP